jgi:ketopantoate reductase
MKILIVGAGDVGKVYGYSLFLGGAKVSFFVKEKYAESTRRGFHFFPLNDSAYRKNKATPPIFWNDFEVMTDNESVRNKKWDYIVLAMSSPALRSGWLPEFLKNIVQLAPEASPSLMILQPGLHDKAYVLKKLTASGLPAECLIDGTIHLVSHEKTGGTEYWFPPGSFAGFSGEPSRVNPLVTLLKSAKFSVKAVPDARKLNVAATAVLTLTVFGLKQIDFSFSKYLNGPWLERVVRAIPEAVAIQARMVGVKTPPTFFLSGSFFKFIFWASRWSVPFDFESHLRHHFLKVDDQMREMLVDFILEGEKENLSVENLKILLADERKNTSAH